jgi:low affinity Fe/Cu permease
VSEDEDVTERRHFQLLAQGVTRFAAKPWVFAAAAGALAVTWLVTHEIEAVNTTIEALAFGMVVLIHARAMRTEAAMQTKLDALSEGVAELVEHLQDDEAGSMAHHVRAMKDAAGSEKEI